MPKSIGRLSDFGSTCRRFIQFLSILPRWRTFPFPRNLIRSKPAIGVLTVALLALASAFDFLTGEDVSATLLYVIPISIACWYLSRGIGLLVAAASGVSWVSVDLVFGDFHPSPAVLAWNMLMKFGMLLFQATVLSTLRLKLYVLETERSRTRKLAAQIISAQEEERNRIARELHDEASQALATLGLKIQEIKRKLADSADGGVTSHDFNQLDALTRRVLSELRGLAVNLRPSLLEDLGLRQSLASLFQEQLRKQGVGILFETHGREGRLQPETELSLFRIVQESVTNIVRHARATRVSVKLAWAEKSVDLEISDNGIGFNPQAVEAFKGRHLGIFGMRERASLLSGSFALRSTPGEGTTLHISLPLAPAAQKATTEEMPHD